MDRIEVTDAVRLVRELRALGLAESTIAAVLKVAGRVFKFARRHCGWRGENPIGLLESAERPKLTAAPERRIYTQAELEQVFAATWEPWRTLFRLAGIVGGRESELLGLWWEDFHLRDLNRATIRFGHQVDRQGRRVELKTDESKAVLPLPRSAAVMLLEHQARSPSTGPRAYVFATKTGRPLGQRNVLRALHRAQERARTPDGKPTFPDLFEHDKQGDLVVNKKGKYVLRRTKRKDLPPLPDFHALRHTAAMDCEDAEEARDLLRHKNSNVTRAITAATSTTSAASYYGRGSRRDMEAPRKRWTTTRGNSGSGLQPPKCTACREFHIAGNRRQHGARMVRKGSPVRVRQRALEKAAAWGGFFVGRVERRGRVAATWVAFGARTRSKRVYGRGRWPS